MQSGIRLTSADKARLAKELEDGITGHLQAVLDMKHRLNTLAPTAVLPPELLAEVFLYLAHSTPSTARRSSPFSISQDTGMSGPPYAWLKVTHVCHHWREVALSAPQLWSTIWTVGGLECLQEFISRSKKALLTIESHGGLLRKEMFGLIMRELPRVVSFNAMMPPPILQNDFDHDAKKLKELVLRTSDTHGMPVAHLGLIRLQDHFADCDLPLLERFELYSNEIPWKSKLLTPTLKHLTLCQFHRHTYNSLAGILQILETLPLLETLSLLSCLPPSQANAHDHAAPIVDLPHLRKLRLSADTATCKAFLQRVSFPGNTSMSLSSESDSSNELEALLGILLRNRDRQRAADDNDSEGTQFPVLRSIYLGYDSEDYTLQLRAWPTVHSLQEMRMRSETLPEPFLDIVLNHYSLTLSLFNILRDVLHSGVESLLLLGEQIPHGLDKAEWQQMFERLPELRELGLGGFAKDNVHQILDHRVPCEQETSTKSGKKPRKKKQACVPHLERLDVTLTGETETFLGRLEKSLAARKKAKSGLKTLVIRARYGYIEQEDLEDKLKKHVESLEVTERPGYYDSEYDSEDEDRDSYFSDEYEGPFPFPFGGMWDEDFMSDDDEDEEGMFPW
ncbi:hypothetical protein BC629DRAFT_1598852 [Irpex lacteus]|nr:hypothetical protein BC629DRAFT_1598852 [Irpex lacteus]